MTDKGSLFRDKVGFNADLSNWDTTKVTTMLFMFCRCSAFDQDLTSWDLSKTTDVTWMFDARGDEQMLQTNKPHKIQGACSQCPAPKALVRNRCVVDAGFCPAGQTWSPLPNAGELTTLKPGHSWSVAADRKTG